MIRGEHAVVPREVLPRRRDERGQPGQEVHGVALDGAVAAGRGAFVLVAAPAIIGPREAVERERRAQTVAAQAFDALASVLVHGDIGVQREPGDERRALAGLGASCIVDGPENLALTDAAWTYASAPLTWSSQRSSL
jgi:hypothetical protein